MALDLTTLPVLLGNSRGDECYPVTTRAASVIINALQPTACLFYDNGNSAGTNVGARITTPSGSTPVNNPNGKLNLMTALPYSSNIIQINATTYNLVIGPNLALNQGSNTPVNCVTLTLTYSNTGIENPERNVGVTKNMNCSPIPSSFIFDLFSIVGGYNTVQIQVQNIENDVTVNLYQDRGGDALIATFSLPTDNYTYCTNGRGNLYLLGFVEPELVNGNEIEFNAGDPMEDASVTINISVASE